MVRFDLMVVCVCDMLAQLRALTTLVQTTHLASCFLSRHQLPLDKSSRKNSTSFHGLFQILFRADPSKNPAPRRGDQPYPVPSLGRSRRSERVDFQDLSQSIARSRFFSKEVDQGVRTEYPPTDPGTRKMLIILWLGLAAISRDSEDDRSSVGPSVTCWLLEFWMTVKGMDGEFGKRLVESRVSS